jgi:hypothetical protein
MYPYTPDGTTFYDPFQPKTVSGQELYQHLLGELNKLGPVNEVKKSLTISLENRKAFASAMIRNQSVKLVLRTNRKITSPRIYSRNRVTEKSFDHTILLESKYDLDSELIQWLGEAYQASK